MHVLHCKTQDSMNSSEPQEHLQKYPDVLAGIVAELSSKGTPSRGCDDRGEARSLEPHRVLLDSLTQEEQELLDGLREEQKEAFWQYKEALDDLNALYQFAAYEAGRKVAADACTRAIQQMAQGLPRLLTGSAD